MAVRCGMVRGGRYQAAACMDACREVNNVPGGGVA